MKNQTKRYALIATATCTLAFLGGVGPLTNHSRTLLAKPAHCPTGRALPEFTSKDQSDWINSKPRSVQQYRGKVLLVDVWTFACWNCYRSFPWLKQTEKKFHKRGLRVVGIHTPEFKRERVRKNVVRHTRKYGLRHPIMMDNGMAYWTRLNNRYWPAFYLVGKRGCIRGLFVGETHPRSMQALRIEATIARLLRE